MRDHVAEWADASREFVLVCDARGQITWMDDRALRHLGERVGSAFVSLAAAGAEGKAEALLARALHEPVFDSELPVVSGERMVTTPTYHVFDLYQVFQGATELPVEIAPPPLRLGEVTVPGVHASAGRGADGRTHLALVNLDPSRPVSLELRLPGVKAGRVAGRLLTAPAIDAVNSFADPKAVVPTAFKGAKLSSGSLAVALPARAPAVIVPRARPPFPGWRSAFGPYDVRAGC